MNNGLDLPFVMLGMSYKEFPPLQAPETYNLSGILKQIQQGAGHPSE
jgi:hypothetical protein